MKSMTLNEVDTFTKNTNPSFQLSEREFRIEYGPKGSSKHNQLMENLSGLDKTHTLHEFTTSTNSSWHNYQPEYFFEQIQHAKIKTPDWAAQVCPNSITVPRSPGVVLALTEGKEGKRPQWQFIGENDDIDKAMHTYERKSVDLRRIGTGWAVSFDLLSDTSLDMINHRNLIAEAQRRQTAINWLTAQMYDATSGTFETTYHNVHQCLGTRTTITKADGDQETREHGTAVDDVLDALHKHKSALNPEQLTVGKYVRGQGAYDASFIVAGPKIIRDWCRELFAKGYNQSGPEAPQSDVRRTAFLSTIFQVPIIQANTARWVADDAKIPGNFDLDNFDAYIVDSDLGPVEVVHSDGWLFQNWKNEGRRLNLWAQSRRSQYHILDPLAITRLHSALQGNTNELYPTGD